MKTITSIDYDKTFNYQAPHRGKNPKRAICRKTGVEIQDGTKVDRYIITYRNDAGQPSIGNEYEITK